MSRFAAAAACAVLCAALLVARAPFAVGQTGGWAEVPAAGVADVATSATVLGDGATTGGGVQRLVMARERRGLPSGWEESVRGMMGSASGGSSSGVTGARDPFASWTCGRVLDSLRDDAMRIRQHARHRQWDNAMALLEPLMRRCAWLVLRASEADPPLSAGQFDAILRLEVLGQLVSESCRGDRRTLASEFAYFFGQEAERLRGDLPDGFLHGTPGVGAGEGAR